MSEDNTPSFGSDDANRFFARMRTLQADGQTPARAFAIAQYETAIASWPPAWGDDFRALILGDFSAPATEVLFPDLGISISPTPIKDSYVQGALTVLEARVTVVDKTDASIRDASARLNVLLGVLSVQNLGNGTFAWRSFITHPHPGGVGTTIDDPQARLAIQRFLALKPEVADRLRSALYWIREAQPLLMQRSRADVIRVFDHWWNAFECIVYALNDVRDEGKRSRAEKELEMAAILEAAGGIPTLAAVSAMYRVVNPGFVGLAEKALRFCFRDEAEHYIAECFGRADHSERLYAIRNAIKHGTISPENPDHLLRVEGRLQKLWLLVWRLLALILGTFHPLDKEAKSSAGLSNAPPQAT